MEVKGYVRTRKGKMERVKPYSSTKVIYHKESASEKIVKAIEGSLNELLTWIRKKKKKSGILTNEQKKYVHKRLKEIKVEMQKNKKARFGKIVQKHLADITKELKESKKLKVEDVPKGIDGELSKRGFTKKQLAKLSSREKDAIYWNEIKPNEI